MKMYPVFLVTVVSGLAHPEEATRASSPILQITGREIPEAASSNAPPKTQDSSLKDPALRALTKLAQPSTGNRVDLDLPTVEGIQTIEPKTIVSEDDIDARIEQIKVGEVIRNAQDLQKVGREAEAIRVLESTLQSVHGPTARMDLHHQLSMLFYQTGDYENAAQHLEKVQAMRPSDFRVANNLAAILMTIGEVDRAFISLEKIDTRQLLHDNDKDMLFKVHFNYSCGYSLRKKSEEALAHLELAARFSPRAVLQSIGDPNLDFIRKEPRFIQLRSELEGVIGLERPSP